jgi:hypothetical protein
MKKLLLPVLALYACAAFAAVSLQDKLDPIEPEKAREIGKKLAEAAAKIENPQVKIDPDADQAVGVHYPEKAGAILVPCKGVKEGNPDPAVQTDPGAPLGYLFLYHITPSSNGKPADADKLRTVSVTDDKGNEHRIAVLLLAVRQVSEDDWRLYAYGQDKKPLVDAAFSENSGPGTQPVAVEVKEIQDRHGKLVVTVFDKYQASFPVEHREE